MWLKYHACLFLAIIVVIQAEDNDCPFREGIFPCTCDASFGVTEVTCKGLKRLDDLRKAVYGLKGHELHLLQIEDSNIGDLPGDLFKGMNIREIVLENTTLTSIGDKENPPFRGLENSLIRLEIDRGFVNNDKPLTEPIRLNHLKKLMTLILFNNVIPEIGDDWFADGPVSLKFLHITNCQVKKAGHSAFTDLKNLNSLHFTGNSVSLDRTAFAETLFNLLSIDLRDNGIEEFPNDMFTKMPALKYIYVDDNRLVQLPVNVWKPLLQQLEYLSARSNPLICDKRIKEFVKASLHVKIIGECASPPKLAERRIADLTLDEIED